MVGVFSPSPGLEIGLIDEVKSGSLAGATSCHGEAVHGDVVDLGAFLVTGSQGKPVKFQGNFQVT